MIVKNTQMISVIELIYIYIKKDIYSDFDPICLVFVLPVSNQNWF